jgi:GntR family transcriptional regulator, transcriptional repressor for pyruvate dehydrogenase complex
MTAPAADVPVSGGRIRIAWTVAHEIVRDIVEHDLGPGDRLPTEAAMLEHFDVGRASLREALRILEGFGLITIRQGQNGGPFVAELRPQELSRTLSFFFHMTGATYGELIELRLIVEPVLAHLAAERRNPVHMERLRDAMAAERAAAFDDGAYLARADQFHYVVSGSSGNRVADLIGKSLRTVYQERISPTIVFGIEGRPGVRRSHAEIGNAILAGDGALAEHLMREHLRELAVEQAALMPDLAGDRIAWHGVWSGVDGAAR